jgi:hypothetical protein
MNPKKFSAMIGILALALWVSPAAAGSISFLVETTPTVTIGGAVYTPAATSSESYTGYASSPGEGSSGSPVSGSGTGYPGTATLSAAQTWLEAMEASTKKTVGAATVASYLQLQGTGPNQAGVTPGFITQTATTVLDYTWDHQHKQTLSFSALPIYEYFLHGNGSGNQFYALTDTLVITLTYYRGNKGTSTVLQTWTVVNNVVTNSVTTPLSDFTTGPTSPVSALMWSGAIGDSSAGDHLYVTISATQSGYTVPIPGSVALLGSGLVGLGLLTFRRRGRRA